MARVFLNKNNHWWRGLISCVHSQVMSTLTLADSCIHIVTRLIGMVLYDFLTRIKFGLKLYPSCMHEAKIINKIFGATVHVIMHLFPPHVL
jgi:hypothetical protein